MAKQPKLSSASVTAIHNAVEEIFARAKARFLTPKYVETKGILIGKVNDKLSLPELYIRSVLEEGGKPTPDTLNEILNQADQRLESLKAQTKANVINVIRGVGAKDLTEEKAITSINKELTDLWESVTPKVDRIVASETTGARNIGTAEGIQQVANNLGIHDPIIAFIIVHDDDVCDECLELHTLDGTTPRVWYMSELSQAYHVRGEDRPSVHGLHPHCRCSMVTILQGYGFDKAGKVAFISLDHDEMAKQRGTQKSEPLGGYDSLEPLQKMAIADIKPGKKLDEYQQNRYDVYDYSHLLPYGYDDGHLRLLVKQKRGLPYVVAALTRKEDDPLDAKNHLGFVDSSHKPKDKALDIFEAKVKDIYKGKGIGSALYEAVLAHAKHNLGVTKVIGGEHSSMASAAHARLSAKHGMDYKAIRNPALSDKDWEAKAPGPYDGKYGDYSYTIKSEEAPEASAIQAPKPKQPKATRKLKAPVPENPNLVVVHNLSTNGLLHANKLGGLAAPSIAVANKDHGMHGFGDISLIASPKMIDPEEGVPVFDADIYSPRHPRSKHNVDTKEMSKFQKFLEPYAKKTDTRLGGMHEDFEKEGHEGLIYGRNYKPALGLAYLNEKGYDVEQPMVDARLHHGWANTPVMQQFVKDHGIKHSFDYGDDYHKRLSEAASQSINHYVDNDNLDPEDAKIAKEHYNENLFNNEEGGLLWFGRTNGLLNDLSKIGTKEVDKYAYEDAINNKIKELGEPDFHKWVQDKTKNISKSQYIPKYNPNTGSSRKIPYTLDNILKEVTKKVRQGEDFNYGLGTARAAGAKKFRNLDQIKQNRNKIVNEEQFKVQKEAIDKRFSDLAEKIGPYHNDPKSFRIFDNLAEAIGESYKHGKYLSKELQLSGFNGVPSDLQKELAQLKDDLVKMPTSYFEAKPQRVVNLNEFHGAAVPKDVTPEALQALMENGVHHIEYYDKDDKASRAQAVQRIADKKGLYLSEGALDFEKLEK